MQVWAKASVGGRRKPRLAHRAAMADGFWVLAVGAMLVAPSPASARWFWQSDETVLTTICEGALKERLKAPSTYRLIESRGFVRREATRDEFMGWFTPEAKTRSESISSRDRDYRKLIDTQASWYDKEGQRKDYVSVLIEYEADNSFGTPIRDTVICEGTVKASEPFDDVGVVGPSIDGETAIEWAAGGGGS